MTDQMSVVYKGRVVFIPKTTWDHPLIDLWLGFNVRVSQKFAIEGIDASRVPTYLQDNAHRCLLLLLVKKRVLVHTMPYEKLTKPAIARLYLDESAPKAPDECVETVYSVNEDKVSIADMFSYLERCGFDPSVVKDCLSGKNSDGE